MDHRINMMRPHRVCQRCAVAHVAPNQWAKPHRLGVPRAEVVVGDRHDPCPTQRLAGMRADKTSTASYQNSARFHLRNALPT